MRRLGNVRTSDFRRFLLQQGCTPSPGKGSHEKWTRAGLMRPVIVPLNQHELPEFIVLSNLRTLGLTREALIAFLDGE